MTLNLALWMISLMVNAQAAKNMLFLDNIG
jgi:hypothetical protein